MKSEFLEVGTSCRGVSQLLVMSSWSQATAINVGGNYPAADKIIHFLKGALTVLRLHFLLAQLLVVNQGLDIFIVNSTG